MSVSLEMPLRYYVSALRNHGSNIADDASVETDASLAARARAGEYDAFERLVRMYRNDVFALAYRYLGDREEAWDISQEVFIKAHRGLGRFRGSASFKTWILRITANACKDFFKKRRLRTVALDGAAEQTATTDKGPVRALENVELGQAIESALNGLSAKHRLAFTLREYQDLSYAEIAETMKCSVGTVMSRLHHARKKLQEALKSMGVTEG